MCVCVVIVVVVLLLVSGGAVLSIFPIMSGSSLENTSPEIIINTLKHCHTEECEVFLTWSYYSSVLLLFVNILGTFSWVKGWGGGGAGCCPLLIS